MEKKNELTEENQPKTGCIPCIQIHVVRKFSLERLNKQELPGRFHLLVSLGITSAY